MNLLNYLLNLLEESDNNSLMSVDEKWTLTSDSSGLLVLVHTETNIPLPLLTANKWFPGLDESLSKMLIDLGFDITMDSSALDLMTEEEKTFISGLSDNIIGFYKENDLIFLLDKNGRDVIPLYSFVKLKFEGLPEGFSFFKPFSTINKK